MLQNHKKMVLSIGEHHPLHKSLAMATAYVAPKTGEIEKLSASDKILLSYMIDKIIYYKNNHDSHSYESQAQIGETLGMHWQSVGKALRKFLANGVLVGYKTRESDRGQWRWHYTDYYKDLVLLVPPRTEQAPMPAVKASRVIPTVGNDDLDLPF